MNIKNEQRLAAAMVVSLGGLAADLIARGADSLYGQFFLWLVLL